MDNKIKIIIAEDLPILRQHFVDLIRKQPDMLLVGEANNGTNAIELTEKSKADIILMDIEMDDKHDGIRAAEIIITRRPQSKIIFLTIHEDDETVFSAFDIGAVDYIIKSANNDEIVSAIRMAYAGKSPIRPVIAQKIRNEFSRIRKNETRIIKFMELIGQLTFSEREIIGLLMQDLKITSIAKVRFVEESTVKSQINTILKKFNKKRTKEIVKLIRDLRMEYIFKN